MSRDNFPQKVRAFKQNSHRSLTAAILCEGANRAVVAYISQSILVVFRVLSKYVVIEKKEITEGPYRKASNNNSFNALGGIAVTPENKGLGAPLPCVAGNKRPFQ
jgi:hypothetical protein